MTAMLKEAVDYVMRRQNWDQGGDQSTPSDEPDVLDVVNCLTGGGCDTLPNGAKLELKRKLRRAGGTLLLMMGEPAPRAELRRHTSERVRRDAATVKNEITGARRQRRVGRWYLRLPVVLYSHDHPPACACARRPTL